MECDVWSGYHGWSTILAAGYVSALPILPPKMIIVRVCGYLPLAVPKRNVTKRQGTLVQNGENPT
eukprot:scaffold4466_cov170-Skeletonema_marinoi.AAC.2